jgi:hypothetical protein
MALLARWLGPFDRVSMHPSLVQNRRVIWVTGTQQQAVTVAQTIGRSNFAVSQTSKH